MPGGASAGEPGLLADQGGRGTDHDSRREAGARGGADLPHSRGAQAGPDGPVRSELPATEVDGVRLDHDDLRLLALLAEGLPINSVSRRVAMSDRTIRRRVRAICEQLGLKATVQAIVWAARRGLI